MRVSSLSPSAPPPAFLPQPRQAEFTRRTLSWTSLAECSLSHLSA